MDVEDFTRQVKPRKNGSQLLPFKKEIGDLKRKGYSDEQIREWLAQNGITVSRENVRKFIKRHLPTVTQSAQADQAATAAGADQVPELAGQAVSEATRDGPKESTAERLQRLAREQRNEAERTQFQHDKTGNNH